MPALTAALGARDTRLGWTRERRQRMVLRLAGGGGTTAGLHGRLSRGSQVGAKRSPSGRVRTWRQAVGPGQPTASPGRDSAAVRQPHRFGRTTRQGGMRPPKDKGGYQSAGLVTPVLDLEPTALADAYDGRAMIAAPCCQAIRTGLHALDGAGRRWIVA